MATAVSASANASGNQRSNQSLKRKPSAASREPARVSVTCAMLRALHPCEIYLRAVLELSFISAAPPARLAPRRRVPRPERTVMTRLTGLLTLVVLAVLSASPVSAQLL